MDDQRIPFYRRNFDADSDDLWPAAGWGEFVSCQGKLVMSNAFPQTTGQASRSAFITEEDSDWDTGMEHDVVSLLEENARLRALVVRLSDLVLKSVVDQK